MHVIQVATILCLVVQHCADVNYDPRTVCSLLQVDTACRAAVQRCTASWRVRLQGPAHLAEAFAAWLPNHRGLIQQLYYTPHNDAGARSEHTRAFSALAAALSACHSPAQGLPPLDLTDCCLGAPGATCGGSLHQLVPVLASLTNLEHLYLGAGGHARGLGPVLAQLQELTHLSLRAIVGSDTVTALPRALSEVVLAVHVTDTLQQQLGGAGAHYTPWLDFSHVGGLERLDLNVWYDRTRLRGFDAWADNSSGVVLQLPVQMTELNLAGPVCEVRFPPAADEPRYLCCCALSVGVLPPSRLGELLAKLPGLEGLSLSAKMDLPAYDCAFEQLSPFGQRQLAAALDRVDILTELSVLGYRVEAGTGLQTDFGEAVARLEGLRVLCWSFSLTRNDYWLLTGLTGLTKLHLYHAGPGMDDVVFDGLCAELVQLEDLEVTCSNLHDCALVFNAVVGLLDLRRLCLGRNHLLQPSLSQLEVLGELRALTYLCLPYPDSSVTHERMRVLSRILPGLQELEVA